MQNEIEQASRAILRTPAAGHGKREWALRAAAAAIEAAGIAQPTPPALHGLPTSRDNPPRLRPRQCGGWLALSATGDPVQIGVTADTEDDAMTLFLARRARWAEI